MSNTNDRFQNLRDGFSQLGDIFKQQLGADLILSFPTSTEEEYSDPEQSEEDNKLGYETEKLWAREAESRKSTEFIRDFREVSSSFNFTHFVDGSVRTIKALDGVDNDFVFPIVIGQIGASSIKRDPQNKPVKHHVETKETLLMPLSQLSDTLKNKLFSGLVGTPFENEIHDPTVSPQDGSPTLKDHEKKDYAKLRSHAGRRARYEMAKVEGGVLQDCVGALIDDTELVVLDGSLIGILKETSIPGDILNRVIGISKSYSTRPLNLMGEYLQRNNCVHQLLKLKEGERTDAIELHIDPTWVVTWYQRIRPRARVESPLNGIVKVETHFPNYPAYKSKDESQNESSRFKKDWSQVWDDIARTVYDERFPIPFHEQRWHALLYPVNCCERILKSSFLSFEVLRGLCSQIRI